MNKKWLRYALIAAVAVLAVVFAVNYTRRGGDLGELAGQAVQVLSDTYADESVPSESLSVPIQDEKPTVEAESVAAAENIAASETVPMEEVSVTPKDEGYLVSVGKEAPKFYKKNAVTKGGEYDSRDEVAIYLFCYRTLPENYITKGEAQALGWQGGGLDPYDKGKSIGGDRFGNREGILPSAAGRKYTECDIGTRGKSSRGAKRIVFSSDGLIFYTADHYEHFDQIKVTEGSR